MNNPVISVILKSSERLSLQPLRTSRLLIAVIGGSEISNGKAAEQLSKPTWLGSGCRWSSALYLLTAAMVFGGAAGTWFTSDLAGGGTLFRMIQLATGSIVMGLAVAVVGSLLFGRNPIRWGIGMPVLVYLGGALMALVSGRNGAMGLVFGAPILLGCSIAAGVMGAFLIDGIFRRPDHA